jgi:DHA1 family tetracycline resistance protein-like MFS transporter
MTAEAAPRPTTKRAVAFVFATVLIDMIGLGLIIPVVPTILRELTHTDTTGAATYGGLLFFAYALMQFVFAPIIGGLSDAYGRRPLLLLAVLGLGLDHALTAFAPTIGWLFVGRLLAGMCGASFATASAYIADVTEPEERGKAFGLMGAAWGVGFVLGPALGGLLGGYGPRIPFFVAAGLAVANAIYGFLVLPESLAKENRRPFSLRRANPLGSLVALKRERISVVLLAALFLYLLANTVYPSVWTFYTMDRYAWNERLVGASLAAYGIVGSIVQATAVGPVLARIGERRAALLALAIDTAALAAFGWATHGWMIFALIALASPSGIAFPALKAVMSRSVPANAQGTLQGAVGSLEGIASIVGPLVMTGLFSAFGGASAGVHVPGAPFFCAAALTLVATLLLGRAAGEATGEPG